MVIGKSSFGMIGPDAKSGERPFLLSVHYREPHTPYAPMPEEDWNKFRDIEPKPPVPSHPDLNVELWKTRTREYLGCVASVDPGSRLHPTTTGSARL